MIFSAAQTLKHGRIAQGSRKNVDIDLVCLGRGAFLTSS